MNRKVCRHLGGTQKATSREKREWLKLNHLERGRNRCGFIRPNRKEDFAGVK